MPITFFLDDALAARRARWFRLASLKTSGWARLSQPMKRRSR